jgi:hypothetical protein
MSVWNIDETSKSFLKIKIVTPSGLYISSNLLIVNALFQSHFMLNSVHHTINTADSLVSKFLQFTCLEETCPRQHAPKLTN